MTVHGTVTVTEIETETGIVTESGIGSASGSVRGAAERRRDTDNDKL